MARVLMINPLVRQEDVPQHVPYGLALLASILDAEGHQYQVYDANAWRAPDEVLVEVLKADDWDVVATGGISTTYGYVKKTVNLAAEHAPNALVVAGGGLVTSIPQDIMRLLPAVDIGVIGEAFETFPEVLRMVDKKDRDWKKVHGIIWRADAGVSRLTPPRAVIENLDSLPYPKWDAFPLDIYFRNSGSLLGSEENMLAQRRLDINGSFGCPFICRFCFHLGLAGDMQYVETDQGPDVIFTHQRANRLHSPRYIVNMVKYLRYRYGVDNVAFLDENLLAMNVAAGKKWLPEICDLWIKEGLQPRCIREDIPHSPESCDGVHWSGTSHATLATPELMRTMREAGCTSLVYGLESFSKRVLKNVGKGATPESNERAIRVTLEAGIRPIPNQIMGFPDDFFDSLRDSVHAWERIGIQVRPFFATPYPGSEWYSKYKDKILEQYDGDLEAFLLEIGDATRLTAVICENLNAVELLGLRELMVARDLKRIDRYEKVWRGVHGEPHFSDVRWEPAMRVQAKSARLSTAVGTGGA